jgi:hypothetical protein
MVIGRTNHSMMRRYRVWVFGRHGALTAAVLTILLVGAGLFVATRQQRPAVYSGSWADQTRAGPILLVPGYGGRKGALDADAACGGGDSGPEPAGPP